MIILFPSSYNQYILYYFIAGCLLLLLYSLTRSLILNSPLRILGKILPSLGSMSRLFLMIGGKGSKGSFKVAFLFLRLLLFPLILTIILPRKLYKTLWKIVYSLKDSMICKVCYQEFPLVVPLRSCPNCKNTIAMKHILSPCICKHKLSTYPCPICSASIHLKRQEKKKPYR